MIRVIYLLETNDGAERARFICDSVNGIEWRRVGSKGKMRRITDREMVDIAARTNGWVDLVYTFGSNLIHLSRSHDYKHKDPFRLISPQVQEEIRYYLAHYHSYREYDGLNVSAVVGYLPDVMNKIASNLEYYISELERDQ